MVTKGVKDRMASAFSIASGSSSFGSPGSSASIDTLESSQIYIKFHSISSRCKSLNGIIGKHSTRDLYNSVVSDFAGYRLHLLSPSIRAHLDLQEPELGVTTTVRVMVAAMRKLERMERGLWSEFFPAPDSDSEDDDGEDQCISAEKFLEDYLSRLFAEAHSSLRRLIIKEVSSATLCSVVNMLKDEVKERRPEESAKDDTLRRVGEDAVERIVFCCRRDLQREVISYKPTGSVILQGQQVEGGNKGSEATEGEEKVNSNVNANANENETGGGEEDPYGNWVGCFYVALRDLLFLSARPSCLRLL